MAISREIVLQNGNLQNQDKIPTNYQGSSHSSRPSGVAGNLQSSRPTGVSVGYVNSYDSSQDEMAYGRIVRIIKASSKR